MAVAVEGTLVAPDEPGAAADRLASHGGVDKVNIDSLASVLTNEGAAVRDPTLEELRSGQGPESLPEALQTATRDDTMCQYCGVSYLVFSEVQTLNRKLASATAELDILRARADTLARVQSQLDASEARGSELTAQLAEATAQLTSAAALRDAAVAEARAEAAEERKRQAGVIEERWRARLDAEVQRGDVLERQSRETAALLPALHSSVLRLRGQLSQLRQAASEEIRQARTHAEAALSSASSAAQDAIAARSAAEHDLQRRVDDLTQELASAHAALQRSEETHASVTAREGDVQSKLRETAAALDSALARVTDSAAAHQRSEATVSSLQQEVATLHADVARISRERDETAASAAASAARIDELQAKLDAATHEAEALTARLDGMAQAAASVDARIEAEVASRSAAATAALQERDSAVAAMQAAQERASYLTTTLNERDMQCRHLRSQVATGAEQLAAAHAAADELVHTRAAFAQSQVELANAVAARNAAAADAAALRAEIHTTSSARDEAVFELATARGDTARTQVRAEQLQAEIDALTSRLAKRMGAEGAAASSSAEALAALEGQLAAARAEVDTKASRIEHLEAVIHEECAERTYLLEEMNRFRAGAHMPALSMEEVSAAARSHVSPAVQSQVQAILGGGRGDALRPPLAPGVQLPPIAPSSRSQTASLSPPVSREDEEWRSRRAPVSVAGAPGGRSSLPPTTGPVPPRLTTKQGMSARMSGRRR